jgi:hypothetical protein
VPPDVEVIRHILPRLRGEVFELLGGGLRGGEVNKRGVKREGWQAGRLKRERGLHE